MVLPVAPGFQLGDRVSLLDGRSGTITAIRPNEDEGFWEYLLDPLFEFFPEFDLALIPADAEPSEGVPEPEDEPPAGPILEPAGEFVTPDEMREFVVSLLRLQPPSGITRADLDQAMNQTRALANLAAQTNLAVHVRDVEQQRAGAEEFQSVRFQELESRVTTTLSEIEKRSTDLETAAEESSGSGFLGFVSGLGGLVRNPVDWIMSRLGDHIRDEVNDGLNR